MTQAREHFFSYLVRLWPITDSGQLVWRGSIESPSTRERLGFPDLSALRAFLEIEISQAAERRAVQSANGAPATCRNRTGRGNRSPSE